MVTFKISLIFIPTPSVSLTLINQFFTEHNTNVFYVVLYYVMFIKTKFTGIKLIQAQLACF